MSPHLLPLQMLLMMFAGWINRRQLDVIEYLQEENRMVKFCPAGLGRWSWHGLGLSIVHNVVRLHGGEVTAVLVDFGHGYRFEIRVPADRAPVHQ